MLNTLKFIFSHPLNKDRRFAALFEWLRWQIGSRLLPGAVVSPFVNDAVLLAEPGMTGATGNVYCGLAEFEDMGFVLHFLRTDDLFVDVGANIGSYSVLASKTIGSESLAIEALPETYEKLMRNFRANDILDRVEPLNCALGDQSGEIYFTSTLDTMNHAVSESDQAGGDVIAVPVSTLDQVLAGRVPSLIKIDVEGYETPVIGGATETLASAEQAAVIMELNGCGKRYGFSDDVLYQRMRKCGYISVSYDPFSRELCLLEQANRKGNTIFVKHSLLEGVRERLKSASCFHVKGHSL